MKAKLMTAVAIVFGILAMASCSTVKGVGEDVQTVGHGVSKGASTVQSEIRN
jgi:predicted small secreted protein